MIMDLKKEAMSQFKAPFSYHGGFIFDADSNMVSDDSGGDHIARVRGWGRLGYLENGGEIQDKIGELIAEALTEYWNNHVK
jgi:hypothetical protein